MNINNFQFSDTLQKSLFKWVVFLSTAAEKVTIFMFAFCLGACLHTVSYCSSSCVYSPIDIHFVYIARHFMFHTFTSNSKFIHSFPHFVEIMLRVWRWSRKTAIHNYTINCYWMDTLKYLCINNSGKGAILSFWGVKKRNETNPWICTVSVFKCFT